MKELMKNITENYFDVTDLQTLSKVTLEHVMTFNVRRGGEVSKTKLSHWAGGGIWKMELKDRSKCFRRSRRKILAERLQLCYLEGKKKKVNQTP